MEHELTHADYRLLVECMIGNIAAMTESLAHAKQSFGFMELMKLARMTAG